MQPTQPYITGLSLSTGNPAVSSSQGPVSWDRVPIVRKEGAVELGQTGWSQTGAFLFSRRGAGGGPAALAHLPGHL